MGDTRNPHRKKKKSRQCSLSQESTSYQLNDTDITKMAYNQSKNDHVLLSYKYKHINILKKKEKKFKLSQNQTQIKNNKKKKANKNKSL